MDCYKRIGNPHLAAEVIALLESDPDRKRSHPALFLRAKESVRRGQEREVRAKWVGSFVRSALSLVVMGPISLVRKVLRDGGEIVVECLPEVPAQTATREPAARRIKKLKKEMAIAAKLNEFTHTVEEGGAANKQHHGTTTASDLSAAKTV